MPKTSQLGDHLIVSTESPAPATRAAAGEQWVDSMQSITSNDRIQTLGPHPEEAALLARPSRRMATGAVSPVAVLRDARKSALLRTRVRDDIDMIRTMETLN